MVQKDLNGEEVPYIEKLRRRKMRKGPCELCQKQSDALEFHHESYRPERGLYLCHWCHHKVHWYPWKLTGIEKGKLLMARHYDDKTLRQKLLTEYKPPNKRSVKG